jgi:hypothetical protein
MKHVIYSLPEYGVDSQKAKTEARQNIGLQAHVSAYLVQTSDPFIRLAPIKGACGHVQNLETDG